MAFHETDIEERRQTILTRFLASEFSEDVLRSSLFALKLRGSELESAIRDIIKERAHHEHQQNLPTRKPAV